MELSSMLYIIEDAYFDKWFKEIDKADEFGYLEALQKNESLLKEKLTDEHKELFEKYIYLSSNFYETRLFKMCEKVLNEGIKIGMDIQKIISAE